jgi:hypothetical protein
LQRRAPRDDQDNRVDSPDETLAGDAASETTGADELDCCCCAAENDATCVSSPVATRPVRPSNVTRSAVVSMLFSELRASVPDTEPSNTA